MVQVKQVMSDDVETVSTTNMVSVALEAMWRRDVGALPVIDARGRVVGMITDRDCAMALYLCNEKPSHVRVASTMSTNVVTCRPEESVEAVEDRMRAAQIRRVPVVDATGCPIAMVTIGDVARGQSIGLEGLRAGPVVATLSAITRPRAHAGQEPPL